MEKHSDKGLTRRSILKGGVIAGAGIAAAGLTGCSSDTSSSKGKDLVFPDQANSKVRWGFLVDLNRCYGCNACSVACKTEFDVRLGVFRNGVIKHDSGTYPDTKRSFVPWLCNHCANPPCLTDCPVEPVKASLEFSDGTEVEYWAKATYQRPDGLVLIDQNRCVGCGRCVEKCPYKARYLDPVKPSGADPISVGLSVDNPKAADKCSLCVHRLANGVVPACVNTCPAEARIVGNLNDPTSEISQKITAAGTNVSVISPEAGTEPRCYYIGLDSTAYSQGEEPRKEANLQTVTPGV